MTYFVTGATGFIGRFLVDKLVARRGQPPRGQDREPTIYVLGLYRSDRHTLHIRRFR